jgi:hypothetical protein
VRSDAEHLHSCPVCGGAVTSDLGLRDYSTWLLDKLPDRVGASDVDLVLEQASTGRVLVIEFKKPGQRLGVGQRLMFQWLVRAGATVWLVWEGPKRVTVSQMDATGTTYFQELLTPNQLGRRVSKWWAAGL